VATISDIARDAGVSVETVMRVLNRQQVSTDISAAVAAALERNGFPIPRHLAGDVEGSPSRVDQTASDRGQQLDVQVGWPTGTSVGEVLAPNPTPLPPAAAGSRDYLMEAMVQAAGAGTVRSGVSSSLRYQSLEIGPLAERITIVDQLLERLAENLELAKDELRRGRTERVEDLALLVDLVTTSWRTMDNRLSRIERKLNSSQLPNGNRGAARQDEHLEVPDLEHDTD
jgi:hypothetical protein